MQTLNEWLDSNNISVATIITPDLDYSWYKYVATRKCNLVEVTVPFTPLDKELCHPQSICLALLYPSEFDWSQNILFGYDETKDNPYKQKLEYKVSIYANPVILVPTTHDLNSEAINLWNITDEDIALLQQYKNYILEQNVTLPEYTSLTTILSKLMWIFIHYNLTNEIDVDELEELSTKTNTLLETMFCIVTCHTVYEKTLTDATV